MSTYGEIVYMVLDEVKGMSDDFTYSEEHILYLIDTTRAFLLKQKYSDIKKQIPYANYQTIYTEVAESALTDDALYSKAKYLKTSNKIPEIMPLATPRIFTSDYYQGEITYISRDRMRYVGYNKYLKNIIYCSIHPDKYLYFKSFNENMLKVKSINFTAVFQSSLEALKLYKDKAEVLDTEFPMEESLIQPLIEIVIKELTSAVYRPEDTSNNAKDDLEGLAVKTSK
jgi:hypothetical protein